MNEIVFEYSSRKRLAALGLVTDLSSISADKADAFIEIDLKLQQIQQEKSKKGEK